MRIAIGTTRAPKIEGIKAGVAGCPYFAGIEVEYLPHSVESDISAMPITVEEVMLGSENRARNLKKAGIEADYYVGIEGGTTRFGDKAYLFGNVYVMDASGKGSHGFSPMVEVPALVDRKLYEDGLELGPVMSELAGVTEINSQNGSMGAWTEDMFTRADEFSAAFRAAIAPFYNAYYRL
jgi:inosine/xanthosine triphosphatase